MAGYYCRLDEEAFNEVLNVLSLIARGTTEPEKLWKIVNISMRLMKKKRDKNSASPRELVAHYLGRERTFLEEKNWVGIWQYIKERGIQKPKPIESTTIGSLLFQGLRGLGDFVTGTSKSPSSSSTPSPLSTIQ